MAALFRGPPFLCSVVLMKQFVSLRTESRYRRLYLNHVFSFTQYFGHCLFLGGMDKSRILKILKPHIFFDDQMIHLENLDNIPAVHIPFGIANQKTEV